MIDNKYIRSKESCSNRFSNLKKRYMELYRGLRSGDAKPDWPFYEQIERILGENHMLKPHTKLDSFSKKSVEMLTKRKSQSIEM